MPDEPTSTAGGPRPATGDPTDAGSRGGQPMSDGSGSKARTYFSYLLAVAFVVIVLGMAVLTAQMLLNAV